MRLGWSDSLYSVFMITTILSNWTLASHDVKHFGAEVETVPSIMSSGASVDDPSVYFDGSDSLVVATYAAAGKAGLASYDLDGKEHQFWTGSTIGDVDILGTLVAAVDKSNNAILFLKMNKSTRMLSKYGSSTSLPWEGAGIALCQFNGNIYSFTSRNSHNPATILQHRLSDTGSGISSSLVRSFAVGSLSEGMACDEKSIFIGEENIALWSYSLDPSTGDSRVQIDSTSDGHIRSDVEGVAVIRFQGDTDGFIVACSQSLSTFSVYELQPPYNFLLEFEIISDSGIDSVELTDGISAYAGNMGSRFPRGIFVAHDNNGGISGNYKYVDLGKILDVLPSVGDGSTFGTWNPWELWSICDCSTNTQTRTRTCSSSSCDGPSSEIRSCSSNLCDDTGDMDNCPAESSQIDISSSETTASGTDSGLTSYVVDGLVSTVWKSNSATNAWVQLRLTNSLTLCTVILVYPSKRLNNARLETVGSLGELTTFVTFQAPLSSDPYVINLQTPVVSSIFRLHVVDSHTSAYISVREISFFGIIGPSEDYGQWGEWSSWSVCSCETGYKVRNRECSTSKCTGESSESQECDTTSCNGHCPPCNCGTGMWLTASNDWKATASGTDAGVPDNFIDGNIDTNWRSAGPRDQMAQVSFGKMCTISGLRIHRQPKRLKHARIEQVLNDKEISTVSSFTVPYSSEPLSVTFAPTKAAAFRLYAIDTHTQNAHFGLKELEWYGVCADSRPAECPDCTC